MPVGTSSDRDNADPRVKPEDDEKRGLGLERVLFSWKQFEWMDFSLLTHETLGRTPQQDVYPSCEDFDDVRAEKTPQQGVQANETIVFSAIV